ncbi:hypothetical protein TH66_19205 [Carbonactinospora thermoautotrophica]|uniref:Carboxymuconolactone decarboxylase-like domain-containing protein n=1 Tax=Carbonactinospora thermoautotrophica TaxID=1469144 RepID=A0A132MK41_9ACTN|nr:hypothetical protein TH66_19205 [Carbonactinospora thermoautotrophica]KWX08672.1 hypothetical protein TR74_13960 [Carbonactinospora thermoautotrophica]
MARHSTERISRLRVPDESELTDEVRAFFAESRARQGYVLNYFRAHALNSENLARFNAYLLPFLDPSRGRLPYAERELIATVVSAANRCAYCHLNHVRSLGAAIGDKARAQLIALDYRHVADLSERERALADLATKITEDPRSVGEADFERLRGLGLDDQDILEAIEIAAIFNATNRISIALGVVPDKEFFEKGGSYGD